jgi:hypothetical protein
MKTMTAGHLGKLHRDETDRMKLPGHAQLSNNGTDVSVMD